jgi:hypothetical protein
MFAMLVAVGGATSDQFERNDTRRPLGTLRPRLTDGGPNESAQLCNEEALFLRPAGTWDLVLRLESEPFTMWSEPRKTVTLRDGESLVFRFSEKDFTQTGTFGHCPFIAVYDPDADADMPAFEVLAGRDDRKKRGIDRYRLTARVSHHVAQFHIRELEPEISFVSSVALETADGARFEPSQALPLVLRMGDEVTLSFTLRGGVDGDVPVTLLVDGYYQPINQE